MSTARQRACAHIAATLASGHSIYLHLGCYQDGSDGLLTIFNTGAKGDLAPAERELASAFDPGRKTDRDALATELTRRGMVE